MQRWQCPIYNGSLNTLTWSTWPIASWARNAQVTFAEKPQIKINILKELYNLNPILNEKTSEISGNVIYVDNYDNVVTNISKNDTFITDLVLELDKYRIPFT